MPELPEVETMVRGIRPFLAGKKLLQFKKCRCKRRPIQCKPAYPQLARRIKGDNIQTVSRIAKRIIIEFESEQLLVIEPRMTGLILADDPPSKEHLRFEFCLEGTNSVFFWDRRGLGTVTLYYKEEFQQFLDSGKLGPDALVATFQQLFEKFQKTKRAIKVVLLDQKVIAGVGNLYASEILFLTKTHPETPANQLSKRQTTKLQQAILNVLTTAIKHEGSTLSDGTYRNVLNQNGSYQNQHRVYQKEGQLCPNCRKERILRIVQTQRSTFYCPNCQSK